MAAVARRRTNGPIMSREGLEETAMTEKKKPKSEKKQSPKPDALTKAGKKGDVELTEKELSRATGGLEFRPKMKL